MGEKKPRGNIFGQRFVDSTEAAFNDRVSCCRLHKTRKSLKWEPAQAKTSLVSLAGVVAGGCGGADEVPDPLISDDNCVGYSANGRQDVIILSCFTYV